MLSVLEREDGKKQGEGQRGAKGACGGGARDYKVNSSAQQSKVK